MCRHSIFNRERSSFNRVALRLFSLIITLTVFSNALSAQTVNRNGVTMYDYNSNLDTRSIINKIGTNHQLDNDKNSVKNLGIAGATDRYFSGMPNESWGTEGAFIEVELKDEGLKYGDAEDDDCLLVYVRRDKNDAYANAHPTAFKVVGQFMDQNENVSGWIELFYAYLLYRGPETQEYSSKVLVKKLWKDVTDFTNGDNVDALDWVNGIDNKWTLKNIRFYVTANNNRETGNDNNHRDMSMARFDVLKIGKGDDYSDTFKDRLHLKTDYVTKYKDYVFENTQGIVDSRNSVKGWEELTTDEKNQLEELGIDFPDFSFITGENTPEPPIDSDQKRQRTHTVDHIIYAIPGDVVALYPYYEMYKTEHFEQNFSHWYDYRTGKRLTYTAPWSGIEYDMLDFAIDPSHILYSENHGFFGSQYLNGVGEPIYVGSVEDYKKAVEYINSTDPGCYIELTADLNFENANDISMIGTSAKRFTGFFNGNGHTISNLKFDFKDVEGVGMFAQTGDGARIENLVIANNCSFIGKSKVGLVGQHNDNVLYVRNVKTEATCYGVVNAEQAAGGIVGKCEGNSNKIIVENCYIGGVIGSSEYPGSNNGVISGWIGTSNVSNDAEIRSAFRNIVVNCILHNPEGGRPYYRNNPGNNKGEILVENCYGNQGNGTIQNFQLNTGDNNPLGWNNNQPQVETVAEKYKTSKGDRKYGTFATFFCPRNPYEEQGVQRELPFITELDKNEGEYVIAADFSQEFSLERNLIGLDETDDGTGHIYEPIISSRHLFHIRDGRAFAEDFSGSPDANKNFIRRNQRMVSARADVPFQIRFDTPVPKDEVSRSNYYYKISDTDYRRVCSMDIEVLDTDGNTVDDLTFTAAESFVSQGIRVIDGVDYRLCGSGAEYYRMLYCEAPKTGNFIVRLIGKDVNGKRIKVYDPKLKKASAIDLVVMEYHITFLPAPMASMVSDAELYSVDNAYKAIRPDELKEQYGEPNVINFDEYMKIHEPEHASLKTKLISSSQSNFTSNFESSFFKWPVKWENSNYSFGYNNRHDYNMYMLTTHSGETPFHRAADAFDKNGDGNGNGLYDRKFYETLRLYNEDVAKGMPKEEQTTVEQGYFYYVNAATDPGVSARLRIEELCQGSTLHVSAWMSEFTNFDNEDERTDDQIESANISFNFVAKLYDNIDNLIGDRKDIKGGDRIVLHSFITGYIPLEKRGQWMHVYYSFVPRLAEFAEQGIISDMVEYYELELDNNCKNSEGADYAIDDIRLYVAKPEVLATQLSPMCGGAAKIRVESPFHTLLQTCGEQEATNMEEGQRVALLYTFIDKEAFDSEYDLKNENNDVTYAQAFNNSVVRFDYDGRGAAGNDNNFYGKLWFNTYLYANSVYKEEQENEDEAEDNATLQMASYRYGEKDEMIVFNSNLTDNVFNVKKEYYIVLATPPENQSDKDDILTVDSETFYMPSTCAKMCVVTVTPSQIVKIDGVIVEDVNDFTVCENQSPVVQVNVWGQKKDLKPTTGSGETPSTGSGEESETNPSEGTETLAAADQEGDTPQEIGTSQDEPEMIEMEKNAWFDWYLGSIEDFYNEKDEEGNDKISLYEALTEFRVEYPDNRDFNNVKPNRKLTEDMITLLKNEKHLRLYESSYVVPRVELGKNETSKEVKLVVIPVPTEQPKDIVMCTDPTELRLSVRNKSPKLQHGLTGITYPMDDVPLRIGLNQIRSEKTGEGTSGFNMKLIQIPVRHASSSDEEVQNLQLVSQTIPEGTEKKNGIVLLVGTNDEEYADLGTLDKDENGEEVDVEHLLWVGEVEKLDATTDVDQSTNLFNVRFKDNFNFKEGYYYRMRFEYAEQASVATPGNNEEPVVCNGHDVFTLKIVPEYLVWTGRTMPKEGTPITGSLNWNNDDNWSRVESKELFLEAGKVTGSHRHLMIDGVNKRSKAYAPLDFTNVIIRGSQATANEVAYEAPYLYGASKTKSITVNGKSFDWPEEPGPDDATGIGATTVDIKYDMAARWIDKTATGNNNVNVGCRPWYMNSCKEIHFKPGATIMNQQELTYEKAWVDVELEKQRWYTLASPLKEVVAGDFYLPSTAKEVSDGTAYSGLAARQETEFFKPITFNTDDYNRFKPAVFQRGWDKSFAKVYELDKQEGADVFRNVMVQTTWSRVYNDVNEQYGGGVGFSIKSDVSALNENLQPEKVVFRLPKADDKYLYYTQDGNASGHETQIIRGAGHYKLNDSEGTITVATMQEGNYFLVGNPFMTYMDIKKFLDTNKDLVEQSYWLVTKDAQTTTFVDGRPISTELVEGTDVTVVAPMQGFFVKSKNKVKELTLSYNASMMRRYAGSGEVLTAPTRSAHEPSMLRITSYNDGQAASSAVVAIGYSDPEIKSVEAIDNRGLEIPSTVYTIGNGMAQSINFCNDAEGLEIGLVADEETETVVRFDGVDAVYGMKLLDKRDGSLTSLFDGMEVKVKGSAVGKLYLVSEASADEFLTGVEWYTEPGKLVAVDLEHTGTLEVNVFDTLGRKVASAADGSDSIYVSLSSGVYVVEITTSRHRTTAKIKM